MSYFGKASDVFVDWLEANPTAEQEFNDRFGLGQSVRGYLADHAHRPEIIVELMQELNAPDIMLERIERIH